MDATESTYAMGPALARHVLPRRGDGSAPEPRKPPGPADLALVADLCLRARSRVAAVPRLDTFLRGVPDPFGAAVLYRALDSLVTSPGKAKAQRLLTRRWAADHGLPFAAGAVTAATALTLSYQHDPHPAPEDQHYHPFWTLHRGAVPLRHDLAHAPDEVRAAARTAIARHRTTPAARAIAAFLLPDDPTWTVELCAEIAAADPDAPGHDLALLVATVADRAQFETVVDRADPECLTSRSWALPTLVATLGPGAALPGLTRLLPTLTAPQRAKVLDVIAEFPSDDAFTLVLTAGTPPVQRKARDRFPLRAARLAPEPEPTPRPAHPEADPADLPSPLVNPPWETPKPQVKPLRVADRPHERWLPGEREEWAARPLPEEFADPGGLPDWPEAVAALHAGALARHQQLTLLLNAPEAVVAPVLATWRPDYPVRLADWAHRLAATHGHAASAFLRDAVKHVPRVAASALVPLADADTSKLLATQLLRRTPPLAEVTAYFTRHGAHALRPLLPALLGGPGPSRRAAEAALRLLAGPEHREPLLEMAAELGRADALRALLDAGPLDSLTPTTPPGWLNRAIPALPPVLVAGRALPEPAVRNLLHVLAAHPDARRAGLVPVKRVCEAGSLARFGSALLERWLAEGAEPASTWVLEAQSDLADDRATAELTALVARWPGEGDHQRATTGLAVLAGIGTEEALRGLDRIARTAKFPVLRADATRRIAEAARAVGLDAEQLADRLVPHGRPAAAVVRDQTKRLERAMVEGRTWSAAEFHGVLRANPLLRDLVDRLLWSTAGGTRFRVAEDGTAADLVDTPVPLPDDTRLHVVHPLGLGADLPAWAELLADHEVVQPFPQLGRPVVALTAAERATSTLTRFDGAQAAPGALLALVRRGWRREDLGGGRSEPWLTKPLHGSTELVLHLDRGVPFGSFAGLPRIRLGALDLVDQGSPGPEPLFGDQDPVRLSEELAHLAAAAPR
ncbi:DUF4132 domain-containing protein [Actinosynnema mirum]|uniref:DUF4132 domain-containing protein n=1 Tax=Actinosynnema mirum (strain ATCC 29888 / DSM 43827 / JCM 3225 / NBRC 14064 / NCIMB 13271 / NRRL B-12336 / IMRU 3971 / 101) TaxID=446462 RepID=C6WIN1_ACTMD|nr:DUF4132 domain-containing protein [Actinosynnema mirum]ACU38121.1 hypothetical protein Amir_4266 [Actinosynnema mirum DSM 43827]